MTAIQLKAFLDAHGVPGAPPAGVFCAVDTGGAVGVGVIEDNPSADDPSVAVVMAETGRGADRTWVFPRSVVRHAPLPDPGETLALRARVAELEARVPAVCDVCDGFGFNHNGGRGDQSPCTACSERGAVLVTPEPDENECRTCHGQGCVDDGRGAGPCGTCLGSGRVTP